MLWTAAVCFNAQQNENDYCASAVYLKMTGPRVGVHVL